MTTSPDPVRRKVAELGHIGIRCFDVEKQLSFYTDVLGLVVTDHDPGLGNYFLSARPDDEHHELLLAKGRDVAPDARLIQQISFRCGTFEDVVGLYRQLKEYGTAFDMIVSHGNAVGVYFFDPDGNRLELYVNVPEAEYKNSVPHPYSRYGAIEDELEGKTPQKAGTVAP